jgi:hypothetical protein
MRTLSASSTTAKATALMSCGCGFAAQQHFVKVGLGATSGGELVAG